MNISLLFYLIVLFLISCDSKKQGKNEESPRDSISTNSATAQPSLPGKELYEKNCLTCHQADGSGVPGMYPPLVQTEIVLGPDNELIKTVLFGRQGKIMVKGKQYNQVMPPHETLTDSQIADILTYVRRTWGNQGSAIDSAEVERVRGEGSNR